MTYTGQVSVGGPADVRELADLTITKLAVGDMSNNAYLLECRATGKRLLVDAAAEPKRLMELVGSTEALDGIVTTHRHPDHWAALDEVVKETVARTFAGRDDADGIPVPTDVRLADGDTLRFGEVELEVVQVVGHTPGSIVLVHRDSDGSTHLFTGDSLFPGGPGRTTSPEEFDSIMRDLQEKVFGRLPDETWFYPGHGDDSTLGAERASIPEWLARRW
ncbi:MBL fold metallo-hydrolase [Aeromicrobium sp. IC_218]|uniref:MBL fold metallo-hydrolase n=1 Tax=Aeromicrobium sp. IC_218 TaxID=2545468 RepID=UPI001040AEEB|nr:MBL fold metallo-hydrolase [Aeromicrobium sp. IC_218]TCJ00097.1 MBL fold metallo-hydrolase [Aeromicrobium sp. IC_218]